MRRVRVGLHTDVSLAISLRAGSTELSLVGALDLRWENLGGALSCEEVLVDAAGAYFGAGHSSIGDLLKWSTSEVSAGPLESVGESLAVGH